RDFDQRHTLNAVASLRLGRGWVLDNRYGYGSGFPWTPVAVDEAGQPRFDEQGRVVWEKTNSRRQPQYRRWDLRLGWHSGGTRRTEVYLEIINLGNHQNVYEYYWSDDYRTRGVSYMLPAMPFFGVRFAL
ncbi:MAG: hypothetical protein ABIL09_26020, partial [Gemmatimonadota bacterium]